MIRLKCPPPLPRPRIVLPCGIGSILTVRGGNLQRNATTCDMITETLAKWAEGFESKLAQLLNPTDEAPTELVEAMRYAALGGGKRLRPFLVTRCCELCGGSADDALPAAAAIECVHVFSLVHDDLPAMDDDDLRRGRPTCHKKFSEWLAILAGDGLLTYAFELISTHVKDPARATAIVRELATRTGWSGMIGGQVADIQGENQPPTRERAEYVHIRKTAALFVGACRMGALSAGASADRVAKMGDFGLHLGCAFQIADDLLDVTATADELGKQTGKDASAGKQSFPAAIGVDASRQAAQEQADRALAVLSDFGPEADDLRQLAMFVVSRRR